MQGRSETLAVLQDELVVIMASWGLKPAEYQVVGVLPAMQGAESRPLIDIATQRYVVRRQPPDLTENDTRFRHAFMRHLAAADLPVPAFLPRPDGTTFAVVEFGIYELQTWMDGQPFVSDGPAADARIAAAAKALAELHQSSASFQWQPHQWPVERSGAALAMAYIELIEQAAKREGTPPQVATGLERFATTARARVEASAGALAVEPGPPRLHIHGDYQPHNLGFGPDGVCSIYDFDAARWDQRIWEVAYSLVYLAGVRWDVPPGLTPPLVDDGLDVPRAHNYLSTYGAGAPPAEGEARLLGDAITLVFPIVFCNGAAEDLVFPQDFEGALDEADALARLEWADAFWGWLDRYRDTLAQAWESAG